MPPAAPPPNPRPAPPARLALWLLLLALPTLAGLCRVYVCADTVRLGYALSQQRQRHEVQATLALELQVELAAAVSPARLVELGTRLGLRPPAAEQIVGAPMPALPTAAHTPGPAVLGRPLAPADP